MMVFLFLFFFDLLLSLVVAFHRWGFFFYSASMIPMAVWFLGVIWHVSAVCAFGCLSASGEIPLFIQVRRH